MAKQLGMTAHQSLPAATGNLTPNTKSDSHPRLDRGSKNRYSAKDRMPVIS